MGLGGISLWQIFILLFIFFMGALPWILALVSKKAKGTDKVVWFLMSFFISWLGYLVYYFLVIKKLPENN
ncbi:MULTISPECIES: hypothetical protein [unclassified Pseudoalteromonas]|uniref:hypothetical protein n=1 Tax=unclassified Pseudoalteromonas TaxID=194690 RepID=UPI001600A220|nr:MULTISPECIES: hypothetical protein [unclassified Pseudoalteromonas]MBB1291617.1 hypothetical protein [Pseudoalteromonas sp. SR41-4]MBB1419747.1 hypothetical protein [Pseudoalteromonas sp. SG44-1]MDN3486838.1 hypothetical protein [Pseudoalteromonas sp. APC 3224]